jgi:hypothetical protein
VLILDRTASSLAPGRYTEPGFRPRLSFEIRATGWVARQFADGFFDIQLGPVTPDVIAVQLCRPIAVQAGPTAELATASAGPAIAALRSNPALAISPTRRGRLAGRPARTIDVDTTSPRDTDPPVFSPVLRVAAGPISLASARRLRITFVELPDGLLAVLVGGSIAGWSAAEAAAAPILASLRIEAD